MIEKMQLSIKCKIPGGFKMRLQKNNYQNIMSRMIVVLVISMFMLPGLMAQSRELLIAEKGNQIKNSYQEPAVKGTSVAVMANNTNEGRITTEALQDERLETEKWMKDTDSWGTSVLSNASDNISESDMKVEDWMKSTVSFENAPSSEASFKIEDWMVCNSAW